MKNLKILSLAATLSLVAGCFTTTQEATKSAEQKDAAGAADTQALATPPAEVKNGNESVPKKIPEEMKMPKAEEIVSNILEATGSNDYTKYTKDFTEGLAEKITKKDFEAKNEKLKEDIGEFKEKHFLGVLNKKLFDVYLWKTKFSKHDDEMLMRLFLIDEDGTYKVYMFNISPF
jgi:hypothetical protein